MIFIATLQEYHLPMLLSALSTLVKKFVVVAPSLEQL